MVVGAIVISFGAINVDSGAIPSYFGAINIESHMIF